MIWQFSLDIIRKNPVTCMETDVSPSWQIENIRTALFLKIEARLTLPIFVLSRAASTSSSTKNGAGRKLKMKQRWSLQFSPTANTCLFRVRYYFTRKLSMGLSGCSPVNGKDQSESGDGLLSSWQVVHGHESFPRSHTVIVDAFQVGLIWILST